ncbi:MAG: MMPL family transporter [Butyrivibrio sp.]|nr:MMPL family transporter [Butyrivibrio sp.]
MIKFGKWIVKHKVLIVVIGVLLLIPSLIGMINTRINYDMLTYLPEDIETVKGQNILLEDFGKGAFSLIVAEGMESREIDDLTERLEQVGHIDTVIWYNSLADISVPMEFLPDKYYDAFNSGDATLLAVFFDTSTSSDDTIQAIKDVRKVCDERCFVTGMSALVTDLKDLCENEEVIYVGIAVGCCLIVMMLLLDSFVVPFLFLASIGMTILYNLGTNVFLGEISYITKALAAVLQLAVTMDYSIFLWHSYSEQKVRYDGDKERAMAHAIKATFTSVIGSSITTVAGFIALCFMSFTLGRDLGIVMAKGVILGVLGCLTILPSLILILDKLLEKTRHKALIPNMDKAANAIVKLPAVFIVIFVIVLVPAFYGYQRTGVYYDMASTLPEDIEYVVSTAKLDEKFDMTNVHMALVDSDMKARDASAMMKDMEKVDGVNFALGFNSLVGSAIPEEIIPDKLVSTLKSGNYQLILISSEYKTATDEVNAQIDKLNEIIGRYDEAGMLIGEAPCTKDLITITDHDFSVVSIISIAAIFVIILAVLKSVSLPIILVSVIEFAIFINLGIPYYTGTTLPFIAPICISTIQLGSTVDYAILMTTRYKRERSLGADKKASVRTALSASIPSITVSALGFFAATFGVAVYSEIDIISSMCILMARGAIISMFSVILVLPSFLTVFDKIICHSSMGFNIKKKSDSTEGKEILQ